MDYPSNGTGTSVYNTNDARSKSRDYLPASVKDAALRPVKTLDTPLTAAVSVLNGGSVIFEFAVATQYTNLVIGDPIILLYIGSTSDLNNLIPGGNYSATQYTLIGPLQTSYRMSDGGQLTTAAIYNRIGVVNTTGSTQTITIMVKHIYVANGGDIIQSGDILPR